MTKDILSKEEILKHSHFNMPEEKLILLKTVDSTNLYCKELAKSQPDHEVLVVADAQTSGRGRMGRTFFSPESTGIYMSLLLDCNRIKLPPNLLTVAAGTAVCRVLREICKIDADIKWVNDIFANNKKVCGILAESISDFNTNLPRYIVVGIGINISTADNVFPDDIKEIAGSVFPKHTTRNEIIAEIFNTLNGIYTNNNIDELISEYKNYSLVLGKKINFTQNGKEHAGIAEDINNEGNLIARLDNGEVVTLKSGEISLGSANFVKRGCCT